MKSCDFKKIGDVFNKLSIDDNQQEIVEKDDAETSDVIDNSNKPRKISMPGWGNIQISKNTTSINSGINFFNPKNNLWYVCPDCGYQLDDKYKCTNVNCNKQWTTNTADTDCYYMTFGLFLTENDELLYQSDLVAPNKSITSMEMSRSLTAGTYDAYVHIQPYKSDMVTPTNGGKVNVKLVVQ